jgi:hypothetical protein
MAFSITRAAPVKAKMQEWKCGIASDISPSSDARRSEPDRRRQFGVFILTPPDPPQIT